MFQKVLEVIMDSLLHFNLEELVKTAGYVGLFAIIFAESGLLVGFFLPGDSLLFTAGFLASQGFLNIYALLGLVFIAAVAGDNVGYLFGQKVGPKLFKKPNSRFFKQENLDKAQQFYEKHGVKTIVLARFMPIVRTFAPIVAGVGRMHYPTFWLFNLIGGALWTILLTVGGYFLGQIIPNVDRYLLPIVFVIIILSVLPSIWHLYKENKKTKK
jgi:membrane-associated protein